MKPLDEVIKGVEAYAKLFEVKGCFDCHYREDDCVKSCFLEDALHYLKEYRDDKEELDSTRLAYLDVLTDYVALKQYWAEQQENPPLTWDELKSMEGKPVWVEALLYKQWAIIAYVGVDHIRFEGANLYAPESRVYMGEANGWQAYRKERE